MHLLSARKREALHFGDIETVVSIYLTFAPLAFAGGLFLFEEQSIPVPSPTDACGVY